MAGAPACESGGWARAWPETTLSDAPPLRPEDAAANAAWAPPAENALAKGPDRSRPASAPATGLPRASTVASTVVRFGRAAAQRLMPLMPGMALTIWRF